MTIKKINSNLKFSPELFCKWASQWGQCWTYPRALLNRRPDGSDGNNEDLLSRLFDHGFFAARACVWGEHLGLMGYELALISRTYCDDEIIDNPPTGLKCVRLPSDVMGKVTVGTPIATVIDYRQIDDDGFEFEPCDPGINCELFLDSGKYLPAHVLPCLLPLNLITCGYSIHVSYDWNRDHNTRIDIVKLVGKR